MKHIILGKTGEALAYNYIIKQGYKIVEKNYKNFIGEIDVIYEDGTTLVFGEVKTRTSKKFGLPREAVTYSKQNKIKNVAMIYIKNCNKNYEKYRFDVIEVIDNEITLIKDAFC